MSFLIDPYRFDESPYDVFLFAGDSNINGKGLNPGPTTLPGTCYEWDGSALIELTTNDVAGAVNGSMCKQFAIDYNANTGKKVVIVHCGFDSSSVYPVADTNNWYTTGTRYAPSVAKAQACLSFVGKSSLTGVIGNLLINDIQHGVTIANMGIGLDSLFSRLDSDFPGVPKLWVNPGRYSVAMNSTIYQARQTLISKIESNSNHYMFSNAGAFVQITGGYNADNIHYSNLSLNYIGASAANWFTLGAYSNKWSKAVISSHFDNLSTTRKGLIDTFISSQYSNGNYFKMEGFTNFKTTVSENCVMDFTFLNALFLSTAVFAANDSISTDGISQRFTSGFTPTYFNRSAGQNDFIIGVKLLLNQQVGAGGLFGASDATPFITMGQNVSSINYRCNDATLSLGVETVLASDSLYSIARNGTTKALLKNDTVQSSVVQASNGNVTLIIPFGQWNLNGVAGQFFKGKYSYWFAAKYSNFDISSFYSEAEALIDGW